ncbi:ribonuclease H-like protein [Karstenula rhodostoma CBS 690.94]|uniref:ribonuclease H n=1 Tax=Karstenula rhodostoma CBS 690.94 TaxID=1392251 RepID=A0A9P4P855_9PLEO|nr:ribonuclease H-like protein [Karstenula rhodostoma CBS 690.94]
MPLGWYLAQGLIPLGESSSDDEEGPCELPDGRLVCGPHGLVICGKCCSDYSFMDDVLGEDEDEETDDELKEVMDATWGPPGRRSQAQASNESEASDSHIPKEFLGTPKRRGTGRVFPTKFNAPPSTRPEDLFVGCPTYGNLSRYVRSDNPTQILIYTDGACLNNGLPNPRAGWAFVHGPGTHDQDLAHGLGTNGQPLIASGRLERKGPFGADSIQSSNRAELRAVIAALRFRHWVGEGFSSVVFATDSEYVVEGCTNWAKSWIKRGWRTSAGQDVKNKDLWEMLLGESERWKDKGLSLEFWCIPREWNEVADAAAKIAATHDEVDQFMDVMGLCI